VTPLFMVPPGAFRPPPKVDSAVVRLLPKAPDAIGIDDPALFAQLVRHAFAQRRKTLRNALSGFADEQQMRAAGIEPSARAETIAVPAYVELANRLAAGRAAHTMPA
jgi:16S rRNA (adenine1518-N6/adenine1519-N6)-dimethyltransferase